MIGYNYENIKYEMTPDLSIMVFVIRKTYFKYFKSRKTIDVVRHIDDKVTKEWKDVGKWSDEKVITYTDTLTEEEYLKYGDTTFSRLYDSKGIDVSILAEIAMWTHEGIRRNKYANREVKTKHLLDSLR